MSGILKMPRVGETMDEGRLTAWLVETGQPFKRGDPILEVETDKTLVEFPALGDGTLSKPLVEVGEMVAVGEPIAEIELDGGPDWLGHDSTEANDQVTEPKLHPAAAEPANAVLEGISSNNATMDIVQNHRLRATPVARRLAKQANIDLSTITGTGRRGRIERVDVGTPSVAALGEIQVGCGIAWCEKGITEGTTVLFIHGFAADHTAWSALQSQMSRSGYRTFAVDLPSHGASTQDVLTVFELASPVIAFAEQRITQKPVHIVAHSMGSLVALALAQTISTASLSLIAPVGVGGEINTHFLDALANPCDVASVERALSSLTHGSNGLSQSAHEGIFNSLSKQRIAGIANSLAGRDGQLVDIRDELAKVAQKVPVSLLLGHRDQIVSWSQALDVSPLVSIHHFPGAGHMPHWEAQAEVQAILERTIPK